MDLKQRVLSGVKWAALTRLLIQIVTWGSTIVVIRILNPGDYGLLAMAGVFMNLLQYLNQGGVGLAVIQAPEISAREVRQAFGLVALVNLGLFLAACLVAPAAAAYFGEPRLVLLMQVLALQFLVSIAIAIPSALLSRRLDFKRASLLEMLGAVAHAGSTLGFALSGFEVWSLVLGGLVGSCVHAVGLLVAAPPPGLPLFDLRGAARFMRFGGHAVGSKLISFLYMQGDSLIGGRVLGKDLLGVYAVALEFASIPVQKVSGVLNPIALAAFSRVQGQPETLRSHLLRCTQALFLFALPVSWGMSCTAEEIVPVLLGEKWLGAVLPLKIIALIMPLRLMATFVNSANMGMGRPEIVTRCALITAVVMIASFLVGVQWGAVGLAYAWAVGFPIAFAATLMLALPSTGLRLAHLASSVAPITLCGALMYATVTLVRPLLGSDVLPLLRLAALVGVGAAAFGIATLLFGRKAVTAAWRLVRS
jgi:teichuronic acid exporter